jgi:hypothetical protein
MGSWVEAGFSALWAPVVKMVGTLRNYACGMGLFFPVAAMRILASCLQ